MPRALQYFERVLIAAADIQGQAPPSAVPDRSDSALASVPATADGTPATRAQLVEALTECERRGWLKLLKVMGPWSWSLTADGYEAAQRLREESEKETESSASAGYRPDAAVPSPPASTSSLGSDLSELQRSLLQAAFDVFLANAAWPTFQYLERTLRSDEETAALLRAMPAGLIAFDRTLLPDSAIRLTPLGASLCTGSERVIAAFTWLMRWLAAKEASFRPASAIQASYPQLTSEDALPEWKAESPQGRLEDLYLAFMLTDTEAFLWNGRGGNPDAKTWTITPSPAIRPFASIVTFDDYVRIRREREPARGRLLDRSQNARTTDTADIGYTGLLAGFAGDSPIGLDALGVTAEAYAIADLLLSRQVQPPLCVGVFGPWGSGKSFFMRLLSRRIDTASRAAAASDAAPGEGHCSNVVQVNFNAWHYVEGNLWASLAAAVFESLSTVASRLGLEHESKRRDVFRHLDTAREAAREAKERVASARRFRQQAVTALRGRESEVERLQRQVAQETLAAVTGQDDAAAPDVTTFLNQTGAAGERLRMEQVSAFATAGGSLGQFVAAVFRLPWVSRLRVLAGIVWPIVLALVVVVGGYVLNRALLMGSQGAPLAQESESAAEEAIPNPSRLVLTPPELDGMARLGSFVHTPRAAKRLVNVYRLLRCLLGPSALAALETGHDTVLLQLALLSGNPEVAPQIFDHVRHTTRTSFWDAIMDLRPAQQSFVVTDLAQALPPEQRELLNIVDAILALKGSSDVTLETFAYWAPTTARFSFIPAPNE